MNTASGAGRLNSIARRQTPAVIGIALLAFSGCALLALLTRIPEPAVHDEFSYLLAADTFAHGRLTNPTHPLWKHFESFYIIQQPTYMSKYPPAQGLILAAGQVITGHAITGVWVSFALMCAAITWMLYGWVSPRWALFGGLLAVIHPQLGIAGYWAQSYWGGAMAASGGALLMGSLRRATHRPRLRYAFLMAAALAILAASRPYEGLVLSLCAAMGCLMVKRTAIRKCMTRVTLPVIGLLLIAATAMGYYDLRITGSILRLPYQVYEETYARAPIFIWQPSRPEKPLNHQVMRDLAQSELQYYNGQDLNVAIGARMLFGLLWLLRSGDVFLIPVIAIFPLLALWTLRNRWALFSFVAYVVFFLGLSMDTALNAHYAAPIVAFNYFFVVIAMRLWLWRNRRAGRIALGCIPLLGIASLGWALHRSLQEQTPIAWHLQRARIAEQLSRQSGRHLIVVKYGPRHSPEKEWVYNAADMDQAKIVWARSMDLAQNCELLAYFTGRHTWSLEINDDDSLQEPQPYPATRCP